MNAAELAKPKNLVKYSFYFSVGGLFITAIQYLTSTPWLMFGYYQSSGILHFLWLLAGAGAVYLLYMWFKSDRSIFGGNDLKDATAFWFLIVVSINQWLLTVGVGFYFVSVLYAVLGPLSHLVFAVIYGYAGYYLLKRWKETNGGMVDIAPAPVVQKEN